ncbi:hypothetical protein H1C71_004175 [Ictidomys tridecemlineatus]|nr:hypothetical protein H1C71_004175 [Ictidomys tridecemlineatus]
MRRPPGGNLTAPADEEPTEEAAPGRGAQQEWGGLRREEGLLHQAGVHPYSSQEAKSGEKGFHTRKVAAAMKNQLHREMDQCEKTDPSWTIGLKPLPPATCPRLTGTEKSAEVVQ